MFGPGVVTAMLVALASGAESQPLDATIENSKGSTLRLASLRPGSKPTILFYEDRDSTAVNQRVKDALFARGRERGLLDAVVVVAVANVAAYDWFPARGFVLAAIRDVEKKVNVPVYLDFKGSLARPPWNLPAKDSTVLLLDSDGVPRHRWQGRLSDAELEDLFVRLEGLLPTAPAPQ